MTFIERSMEMIVDTLTDIRNQLKGIREALADKAAEVSYYLPAEDVKPMHERKSILSMKEKC